MFRTICVLACLVAVTDSTTAESNSSVDFDYDRADEWKGFPRYHFKVADRAAYVVVPDKPLRGRPWVWRARFPGYHAEMDIKLLQHGFYVGYVDVAGLFGSPQAVEIGDHFYAHATTELKLARRPALEGVSRGGLFVYNWAAKNPQKVACIYCDTPVLDFRSWPGGHFFGLGSDGAWKQCLAAYGFNEEQAKTFAGQPVNSGIVVTRARIPLLHIVSENDRVVPPKENTYVLQKALQEHGHQLEVISVAEGTEKSNGHHFDHPAVDRVTEFMVTHAAAAARWDGVLQIVAHRGSSIDRPECTLASVRRAIESGATAVEVDVRTTADGHLVILHDATLDRTTSGKGPVSEITLDDLRKLDAGSWFDPKFRDERVPTLEEVLRLCRGQIDVLLDLKEQGADFNRKVLLLVQSAGDPSGTIVGVRSVEQAESLRAAIPQIRQIGLIATPDEIEAYARAGVETIRLWPKWLTDRSLIPRVRKSRARLHLNGRTGTVEDTEPLFRHRPDSLSSDAPATLIETLDKLSTR